MKVTLKFKLPQQQEEFEQTLNAAKFNYILWELDQWLRGNVKYPNENFTEDKIQAYQECRDKLYQLLNENNIDL
jgi:hypothetical protein